MWSSAHGYLNAPVSGLTGLTQLGARAYDPVLGRFVSVDPVLAPDNPQQNNGYSYAHNNPVTQSDPSGYIPYTPGYTPGFMNIPQQSLKDREAGTLPSPGGGWYPPAPSSSAKGGKGKPASSNSPAAKQAVCQMMVGYCGGTPTASKVQQSLCVAGVAGCKGSRLSNLIVSTPLPTVMACIGGSVGMLVGAAGVSACVVYVPGPDPLDSFKFTATVDGEMGATTSGPTKANKIGANVNVSIGLSNATKISDLAGPARVVDISAGVGKIGIGMQTSTSSNDDGEEIWVRTVGWYPGLGFGVTDGHGYTVVSP
ncbi:hypothetical protein GCM10027406_37850 [Leifsonia lichenia]